MGQEQYYRRSLALLRRDRGWIKPLLVLSAANLVPIVGQLGVNGYIMEWARLTAWGVDSSPKQKNVQVGECIKSGWRAFVVALVPAIAFGLLASILIDFLNAAHLTSISSILRIAVPVLKIAVATFATTCAIYATIYQRMKAGFSYSRIWSMVTKDAHGLVRIAVLNLVITTIVSIIIGIISSVTLLSAMADLVNRYRMWGYDDVLMQITWAELFRFVADFMRQLAAFSVPLALILLIGDMGMIFARLITCTALGLWMRKYDVPHWGPLL